MRFLDTLGVCRILLKLCWHYLGNMYALHGFSQKLLISLINELFTHAQKSCENG